MLATLFVSLALGAQEKSNPVRQDRTDMESIWLSNSNNAAGGIIDAPKRIYSAEFSYDIEKGDFKYAQQGNDNKTLNFSTQGGGIYEKLGGIYLWGGFNYSNENIAGARWNATLIDPLRDEPFFLADSSYSKWKNQKYDISFKAASPFLFDHLIVGVTGNYNVAVGAKQIDPRPYTKMSKVEIIPSLVWKFNDSHSLGADFQYFCYREDGSASNVNHLKDRMAWEFVAPGFFNNGTMGSVGSSIQNLRNYNANALGGGLQYSFIKDDVKVFLGGNYTYKVEDVTCSYTKPQMIGTVVDNRYDITLAGQYTFGNENILFANYKHSDKSYSGIGYFQTYDNTYEIQSWITDAKFYRSNFKTLNDVLAIDYMVTDGPDSYKWKFGFVAEDCRDIFTYYVPKSTKEVNYLDFVGHITGNFVFADGNSLVVNVEGGYDKRKGELDYNGTKGEDIGYTEFTLLDFNFATTDFAKFGADVTYVFAGLKNASSLYATASYKKYCPKGNQFTNRDFITFKLGLSF